MSVIVENIYKNFNDFLALENINLEIKDGELLALLGPSGSGKTTLLRIISGLEHPDKGRVLKGDIDVTDKSPNERGVGFVFQHYALFKHMTIFENVAFGLRVQPKNIRIKNEAIEERVYGLLKLIHLENLAKRYPSELSGGQRQRVALARSLAVEPRILLLDEPFGALDSKVRKELRRWLRKLHDNINLTTIFVTHDQEEAMEVADKVAILSHGKIEQVGTPEEVYHNPINSFVYDFLGNFNVFQGKIDKNGQAKIIDYEKPQDKKEKPRWLTKRKFVANLLEILQPLKTSDIEEENHEKERIIEIYARPYDMEVTKDKGQHEFIPVKLIHINHAGPTIKLELEKEDGSIIQAELTKEKFDSLSVEKGSKLYTRAKQVTIFE